MSIPTTPTAIAGAATEAITATVTGDATLNQGVTWSITSGGGALSAVTTTSVTYTAPLPVTTANAVITATSKTDTTKTATITIPLTPISVGAISPATVNLGTTSTQAFTGAAVSNDSSNSGVTWTISPATGAGTIVAATGAYTAPASVISSVTTVTVTATSVKDPTKSATATITLNPIAIGAISPLTASLNGGGTQNFTGAALTYDGSNSGVTWTISPASGAGTIVAATGAYTAPAVVSGSSPVTVTVTATSVKDNTKSTTATITLNPIVVSFGSTTSATLDAGQQYAGVAATITNDASNSGIAFTVASGGGDIGSSSTTSTTIASSPFTPVYYSPASVASQTTTTITASSVKDPTKTAVFTVTLNPAMSWTTPSSNTATLTGAQTNTAYSYTLVTAGGTGSKTYTVTSGTLPAGLSLNSSTGAITGSPTGGAGSSTFVVRTTDQSSNPSILNGTFTIVVTAAPLAWSSPTSGPAAFTVGTAITPITLVATGGAGSLTYSLNSGTLPAGLSIVGNQLTGTPTQPTLVAGTAVTFKATDSTTPIPQTINSPSITIVVNPVTLAITSTTLPIGTVGTPYSYQLTSTGGTGTVNWSLSAGSLSGTGLTLSSSGLLSGTPLIVETGLSLTFQAQDSATNQQQTKTAVLPLNIVNPLTITTTQSTLPPAYSGLAYPSTTLAASGGSGTGYTWSVTSGLTGSNSLQTLNLAVSAAGVITGTPATTGTANFTVQVTDSASRTTTATYTITAYTPLSLPAANPSSLPAATTTASYTGAINAIGGVGPTYTWTVNGSNATTGSVNLGNGTMQAASSGGNTLNVTGQPSSAGTITLNVSVKDSANTTVGPTAYTIAVSTNYSVGGSIVLNNSCGGGTLPTYTVTLTQGSTTIGTTTTNGTGNFVFLNIPNGTYTVTPSISGPSAVFYPTTLSAVVNNANVSTVNFGSNLGYTVSGTVAYTGTHTVTQANPIYLELSGGCNSGNSNPGTSLSATGAYTIHGVAPGTYTLSAFQDNLGYGSQNASNPTGSTANVTLSTANLSSANVTLTDPATVNLTTAPTLQGVAAFNNGVLAQFKAITNSNSIEMPTSYTLQWSTTSTFTAIAGSMTFPATGGGGANIWFVNKDLTTGCTNCSTLASGTYFFRAFGTAGSSTSANSSAFGPVTMGAPTGGVTVSGSVTYPGTVTGPLYVGFYNYSTGVFYGQYIQNPTSAQAFTVQVPIASTYYFVGVIDNNKNGVVDAGDINDVSSQGNPPLANITGATSSENLTLISGNSILSDIHRAQHPVWPGRQLFGKLQREIGRQTADSS